MRSIPARAGQPNGIENLRQIVVDERTAGRAPPSIKPAK
jgi:hypothetical protein